MSFRHPYPCWIIVFFALVSGLAAWAAESQDEGTAYFEKHIRPLLAKRCYSCHSARADRREGGLWLDSRLGWTQGGDRGAALIPGDVDASELIRAVRYEDPDLQMPPDRQLPAEEIAHLEHWVRMGAPDPRETAEINPTTNPAASDPIAGRQHWAFRELNRTPLPNVQAADWPRNAIDAFILAKLEAEKLTPVPDADRRVLLRRLTFQLHGLPPTPEQIAAFLDDARPDALERLVDQLLASPHFGERWGRHWLDLARYADSNGLDENFLFREAWRYRNWVIDAVNRDAPFDQFVREQLAGDLLPYESLEQRDRQRIGAGFLLVGPKVLLGNDPANQKMEVADEQLDTIGRAILGQTLGCARCHDHKFDPIPTRDYYALAGIMTSTQVMEQRYMLGEQRVMERLEGLGAEGEALDVAYEKYWRELPQTREKEKHAKTALELLEKGNEDELKTFVAQHSDAVSPEAADVNQPREQRLQSQRDKLTALHATLAAAPSIPPRAMIPTDEPNPNDEAIRLAGQFDRRGDAVPRGFLQVLDDAPATISPGQSGRVELAQWLTDEQTGAGRLAARVLANRIWHHLMGRGLVRTVDNFGRTGEPPSHPELLDYLAGELIHSEWSVKSLVRKIVLSRTFALSSQYDPACHAVDPENLALWRANRRRLEPEAMRDAMVWAAGSLDLKPMDSTVWYLGDQATAVGDNKNRRRTDFPCRSVYLPVIRNDLPEIFDALDFANPHSTTGMRPQTTLATQGLFFLNDSSVMDAANATAQRLFHTIPVDEAPAAGVDQIFAWITQTSPADAERESILNFVQTMQAQLAAAGAADAKLQAWAMACHALFASSRFQILE
jgi:hypothetical protein